MYEKFLKMGAAPRKSTSWKKTTLVGSAARTAWKRGGKFFRVQGDPATGALKIAWANKKGKTTEKDIEVAESEFDKQFERLTYLIHHFNETLYKKGV